MTAATANAPLEPARNDVDRPPDDSVVIDLVARARDGHVLAWDALVERYTPLIWSICRKYRLGPADADDVRQTVWVRLVDQLKRSASRPRWPGGSLPRPGGSAGASRAAHGPHAVIYVLDAENMPDKLAEVAEQELLAAERHAALRKAFTHLPPDYQRLIAMLIADAPVPYAEISARLGMPIGSIGPTRRRCLDRMRRHPALAALITAKSGSPTPAMAAARGLDPVIVLMVSQVWRFAGRFCPILARRPPWHTELEPLDAYIQNGPIWSARAGASATVATGGAVTANVHAAPPGPGEDDRLDGGGVSTLAVLT